MVHIHATVSSPQQVFDDLLNMLVSHPDLVAVGEAWTVAWGDPASRDVVLQAGSSPTGISTYVGLQYEENQAEGHYRLNLYGMQGVNAAAAAWYEHQNTHSARVSCWMGSANITYWFTATGGHVVGVLKTSTVYHSFYLGRFLPSCLPTEYQLPLFVAGSTGYLAKDGGNGGFDWSSQNDNVTAGLVHPSAWSWAGDPYGHNAYYLTPQLTWRALLNDSPDSQPFVWPGASGGWGEYDDYIGVAMRGREFLFHGGVLPGTSDGAAVTPASIFYAPERAYVGTLIGVGQVPPSLTVEATVTVDGSPWIVFPNVWRLGDYDLWAMKAE